MRYFLLILFILTINSSPQASPEHQPVGARTISLGGVSLLPADFWSVFNNQAGIATQTNWGIGFAYDSYLGLDKNLSLKSGALLIPTNSGTFGLSMNYYGYSAYHQDKIGLAYGKSLGKIFHVGLQLDYLALSIGDGYGKDHALTFEIGILAILSDKLQIASHIYNPFLVKLGKLNPEIQPALLKFATSYQIDETLLLLAEYEQNIQGHGILKFGMEYQLIKQIQVRLGLSTNPNLFSFGFGLHLNAFQLDFGTSYHQILGFSPKVSLYYKIK
jgi:hypothetical protein